MKGIISLGNDYLKHVIGKDGKNTGFYVNGQNLLGQKDKYFAFIQVGSKKIYPTNIECDKCFLKISFGENDGYEATFKIEVSNNAIIYEMIELKGDNIIYISFINIIIDMNKQNDVKDKNGGSTHIWNSAFDCENGNINDNTLCACTIPLTLKTQVKQMPLYGENLIGLAFDCIGMDNIKVAVIGGKYKDMKDKLKVLCKEKLEYAYSTAGGMYALESDANRESYIIDTKGTLTADTIDKWMEFLNKTGIKQYEIHCGETLRFGDLEVNEKIYKGKKEEIKYIVKTLHENGFHAILHTYGQCMDFTSSFVSPIPKGELTHNEVLTLVNDIDKNDTKILVNESTDEMTMNTGFFFLNSLVLRIGDELIKFNKILKEEKKGFVECERGYAGTIRSKHSKNDKVYHLNQMFFQACFFGDSEEFLDVARKTSEMVNECEFDGIYFDAMDGMRMALHEKDRVIDLHDKALNNSYGGTPLINYYRGKFLNEIVINLERDVMISGSGIGSHGYSVRSRIGAMDHANRYHKQYVDIHCKGNEKSGKITGYSQNIGWWAQVEAADLMQEETTYEDVYEYMLCKSIGGDYSLSFVNLLPDDIEKSPLYIRNVKLMGTYEKLRLSNYFNDKVRKELLKPDKEFTLSKNEKGEWGFYPVKWQEKTIYFDDSSEKTMEVSNSFDNQDLIFRFVPLYDAGEYNDSESVEIFGIDNISEYMKTNKGAEISVEKAIDDEKGVCLKITAKKTEDLRNAGACIYTEYEEHLNLENKGCTGVWIYGDGNNQYVNVQLRSPLHVSTGFMERYIKIDFVGWRYISFVENSSGQIGLKDLPDNFVYSVYRENVKWDEIHSVRVWMFGLPDNKETMIKILPIKALPVLKPEIDRFEVTLDNKTITFNESVNPEEYLEYSNEKGFCHYLKNGELINEKKENTLLVLDKGENLLKIKAINSDGKNVRGKMYVYTKSDEWLSN